MSQLKPTPTGTPDSTVTTLLDSKISSGNNYTPPGTPPSQTYSLGGGKNGSFFKTPQYEEQDHMTTFTPKGTPDNSDSDSEEKKTEKQKLNDYDKLSQIIARSNLQDKASAIEILQDIQPIFQEGVIKSDTETPADPRVGIAEKLLNEALTKLETALAENPKNDGTVKMSYYLTRQIFHAIGEVRNALSPEIIQRIPWLPEELTAEEKQHFARFKGLDEIKDSGIIGDCSSLHTGDIPAIAHPLFDATYHADGVKLVDEKTASSKYHAALNLLQPQPERAGEPWALMEETRYYTGTKASYNNPKNISQLRQAYQLCIILAAADPQKFQEHSSLIAGSLNSNIDINPLLRHDEASDVQVKLNQLREIQNDKSECCLIL